MKLDLDAIAARANAATWGPWTPIEWWPEEARPALVLVNSGSDRERPVARASMNEQGDDDAEFIAAARTDIPALIDRVRELEATVERVVVLAESWRYKGEVGGGPWHEGFGPDQGEYILDGASSDLDAAILGPTQ